MAGTPLLYPTTLPGPEEAPVTPAERRELVGSDPRESAVIQTDFQAAQSLKFRFVADEAEVFEAWYRETLVYGGLWFAADWPITFGPATAVRRMTQPPVWRHVSNGTWDVSCEVEVRGRGELPNYNPLPPVVDCECHSLAWNKAFEDDGSDRGGENYFGDTVGVSTDNPLYGTASFKLGTEAYDAYYLVAPEKEVQDNFTLYWSFLMPAGALAGIGTYRELAIIGYFGSDALYVYLEEVAGKIKFSWDNAWQGTTGETEAIYDYDTIYNVAVSMGGGFFRAFINGVRVHQEAIDDTPGINAAYFGYDLDGKVLAAQQTIDCLRVTNTVEQISDYVPHLPFCICDRPPSDVGWYGPPWGLIEVAEPDVTNESTGEFIDDSKFPLYFGLVHPPSSGPTVTYYILSWVPDIPGSPAPVLESAEEEPEARYGTWKVTPQVQEPTPYFYTGTALIGGVVGTVPIVGYIAMKIYRTAESDSFSFAGAIDYSHSELVAP